VSVKPIAVVQGADSATIQRLLSDVLDAPWRPDRIAGVLEVEQGEGEPGLCGPGVLRNIADGCVYPLFQDLGSGSTACALDPGGVTDACGAVCRNIAQGCDLVILSKFGKLEAESGSGLFAAFGAAMEEGVPILTAVSPRNLERWHGFAATYYEVVGPDLAEIGRWWARHAAVQRLP
jgi:hypothetical protein